MLIGPAKKRKVGAGKAAKAAVEAAMAAVDPEQAAANKAAEKAAKAAAGRAKAAEKRKGKKAADSASGNSNVWGPFENASDEEVDPETLVKSKVSSYRQMPFTRVRAKTHLSVLLCLSSSIMSVRGMLCMTVIP